MDSKQGPRRRRNTNTFTTKSGNSIKLNRSFSGRRAARKDARARQRAAFLSTLPKNRWKRLAYRLEPRRLAHYWFSREGGIMALKITGVGIVICFLLLVGLFAYFRKDLPNITDVSGNNLPGSISYYDSTGKTLLFQDYNAVKRIPVPSGSISPYMKEATIAIEDRNFYHEGAFNIRGIFRAAYQDLFHRSGGLQGASTITEQLVKLNENWTGQRTITVKVKELILAVELSREYSKDDILTGYLDVAPYGGVEYGCESAARDYFGTSCNNLTLPQASMLAAIPQYPTGYSPYSSPNWNPAASGDYFDEQGLLDRQHYVLDQMASQGMITQAQANAAKQVDVLSEVHPLQDKYQGIQAPYFVLAAKHELETKYGAQTVARGGWRVTTTLNMNLQQEAEHLIAQNLPNVTRYGGDDEALVGENVQTGQVVSLVGGVDFTNTVFGQINFAQTNISPGSSVKPYDYTTLINDSKDVGAGSVLYDTESPLPGYPCTNHNTPLNGGNCLMDYDFREPGPVTLRYALGGSRNIPAVKAMLTVGTNKVISTADAMMGDSDGYRCYQPGVDVSTATQKDETQCYGSSAIGDGAYLHLDEHVNGLSTLARLGQYVPQTYIQEIDDASGKLVYKWTQPAPKQVITADAAYIVDSMASDPRASYLPGSCTTTTCTQLYHGGYKFQRYNGWNIAVKTGTTNDNFDGLMTSWTTQYADASWVGYHTRNKAMTAGGMEYMTEPLTRGWIQYALDSLHTNPVNWKQPSDIKVGPAFVVTGHVGIGSEEPSPSTDLYPSWYTPPHAGSANVTIDKVSNKVATSCTPADAKEFIGNGNANAFSVDQFVNGGLKSSGSYNTTATDDVHNCSDQMPTVSLAVNDNDGNSTPDACSPTTGCSITVTASQGTHPLSSSQFPGTITVSVNGSVVHTFTLATDASSPDTETFKYMPDSTNASKTITITTQVTDSVLYQATGNTDSVTVDQGSGGGGTGGGHGFLPPTTKHHRSGTPTVALLNN
jgi:membrane peptidoglycan carboxypeptidase